jgi:NAD(P)-dependent dehydrogenase (short-subunit alcohol dehydrogenase family)
MYMELEGKVAFISGAARGIGKAAASLFASAGAKVVVADINVAAGEATVAEIRRAGGEASFTPLDVTDMESVEAAIGFAITTYGKLDVLYNNAGGSRRLDGSVLTAPIDEFWKTMETNLLGTWLCCRFGIAEMLKTGGGSVINMSSIAAIVGHEGIDAYTASKGAIAALTRSMAVEFARHAVRVNALAPGATKTEAVNKLVAAGMIDQTLMDRHLLGLLEPEYVARAALFLASDASRGMTGQISVIDSGASMTAVAYQR